MKITPHMNKNRLPHEYHRTPCIHCQKFNVFEKLKTFPFAFLLLVLSKKNSQLPNQTLPNHFFFFEAF